MMARKKEFAVYHGDFGDWGDVMDAFDTFDDDVRADEVLYASYERDGYDGTARVVYRVGPVFYEVEDSHCSCDGLNWSPEEYTAKGFMAALHKRDSNTEIDAYLIRKLADWIKKDETANEEFLNVAISKPPVIEYQFYAIGSVDAEGGEDYTFNIFDTLEAAEADLQEYIDEDGGEVTDKGIFGITLLKRTRTVIENV